MPPRSPATIRVIRDDELVDWVAAFGTAFYVWPTDPQASAEARRPTIDLARTIGAFDGDTIVGTFRTFPTKLTLPGGARIDVSAVTSVSVRPTHRRRGTLTRLIADDVERSVARGDAASILIASEWPIYGRYGYGPATWQASWSFRVRATDFDGEPVGSLEVVDVATARRLLPGIYDRCAANQPGEIARPEHRWDYDLGITEFPGRPRWRGSIVVHRDPAGEPDGYARFHGEERWQDMFPDHVLELDELRGANLDAEIDLWRHVARMDLTAEIKAEVRRLAEPMKWYLTDARAARISGTADFLWLRIFDVPRVLGARHYDRDGELVLEVTDDVNGKPGPAAGRWKLTVEDGAAACGPTKADADITVDIRALSAASLGGTRLLDASRSAPTAEHRPGALREAEAMLLTVEPPWCSTWF
jgi:predicted acetyltransferase